MILPTQGPDSTLLEDLADLNLIETKPKIDEAKNAEPSAVSNKKGNGYAKSDDKGGDFAGPDDGKEGDAYKEGDYMLNVGDSAAGSRKNVPVRSGGVDRSEVGPDASNPAKAESEDADGEQVAETAHTKMVPAFLVPTEEEVAEAQEADAEQAQKEMLESAWATVQAYFAEDEDGLNEDGLRGVINAMGYALNVAVEDIALLTGENERLSEAVSELTNLLSEAEKEDEDEEKEEKAGNGDDEEEGEEQAKKLPPWLAKKEESAAQRSNLTEAFEDKSLLSELRQLGEDTTSQALDKQAELVAAFESVRDTCNEIVARIAEVVAEDQGVTEAEDLEVDEEDERVKLALYLDGIAEDSEKYLESLASGEVPFRVAEADLAKLRSDLERGVEHMHTIE